MFLDYHLLPEHGSLRKDSRCDEFFNDQLNFNLGFKVKSYCFDRPAFGVKQFFVRCPRAGFRVEQFHKFPLRSV